MNLKLNQLVQVTVSIILLSFSSVLAQENDSIAKVASLLGKVSIKSKESSEWKKLKVNDTVQKGDSIMTGNGSMATILYKESEIKLTQNSTIIVNQLFSKNEDGIVEVKQGLAWFKLINLGDRKFNSVTPTSSAGVRGTAFASVYDSTANMDLTCVCEGKVEVNPVKQGKPGIVLKGNGVSVKSGDSNLIPISYKGEMAKGESFPGFEKKVKAYPILKNCLSCHTPNGWKAEGFTRDEKYGK